MKNFPLGILKEKFPREFEIWKNLKKRLDEDWSSFSKKEGFYQYYHLKEGKMKFRLLFNKFSRKGNEIWQEWETLSKASFAYNFHLLGGVICNVIFYFSQKGKIEKTLDNEENKFEIKLDTEPGKIPDILIASEKNDSDKIGIEVVEISSSLVKLKGKKKSEELEKLVTSIVERETANSIKEHKKIKPELIENIINENIEEVKVKKCEEKNGVFSFSLDISKKINNISYLVEKLKEEIEKKNGQWERCYKNFGNTVLWTVLSASFTMYLFRTDKGNQTVTDPEIQKYFLSWFLLKKISQKINDTEIKFGYLIITFLNLDYCNRNSFLSKHDPFKKVEHENIKKSSEFLKLFMKDDDIRVVIPNLYVPVVNRKIKILEEDLKELENKFKGKFGFDINSLLYWEFGPNSYTFYAQNLETKKNA